MPASLKRAAALLALLIAAPTAAAAGDSFGVPLPPGARTSHDSTYSSPRGFRDTVTFYARHLARRGVGHRAIPVTRHRGVELARFVATGADSPWLAIHVYRHRGTTFIAVVGAPGLDLAE
jgi:hypothetical protein